jgi:hypothetical protein
MARTQLFVGLKAGTPRQVFRAVRPPKESELGNQFDAVMGPFVTRRGAFFYAQHGEGNPHVQHVSDAERISLRLRFKPPAGQGQRLIEVERRQGPLESPRMNHEEDAADRRQPDSEGVV